MDPSLVGLAREAAEMAGFRHSFSAYVCGLVRTDALWRLSQKNPTAQR